MATPNSTTQHDPDFTTPRDLRPLAWSLILLILIFALAAAGRTILVARSPEPPVSMALRAITLPAGQCFAPQPGDVLHISVMLHDAHTLAVSCLQAGPQVSWSKYR